MKEFDTLEIQKNIEEKRLILGQKFENFLLRKINIVVNFLRQIFADKSCAFFGCFFIIAISILVRSSRDIGPETASFLAAANLPIIFADITSNLAGIISLYFSYRILAKSSIAKDRTILNLIILSFAAAYFLRVFCLKFNEFGTRTSFILACAFPCIASQFRFHKTLGSIIGAALILLMLSRPQTHEFSLIEIFKADLFPILLFTFLTLFQVQKFPVLKPFFLLTLSACIIAILQPNDRSITYSLSLPFMVLATYFLAEKINWKKDGLILFLILFLPQFDSQTWFVFAINLCSFWFVFAATLLKRDEVKIRSWIYFIVATVTTITLSFIPKYTELSWILSALIFAGIVSYNSKTQRKTMSLLAACCVFAVISHLISLHLAAIFNYASSQYSSYKSPNYVNDQMIKTIKKYDKNGDEIVVISSSISGAYPVVNYAQKTNILPQIYQKNNLDDDSVTNLKQQLSDKVVGLVFVEKKRDIFDGECEIGFLESYFRDADFKKIFSENYVFLNRIIQKIPADKKIEFFDDEKNLRLPKSREFIAPEFIAPEFIERDVEIYIRK